jgi:ribonuclease-3
VGLRLDPGHLPNAKTLASIHEQLGVKLSAEVLLRALTHTSWANENPVLPDGRPTANNERDEFLGDAVLDLAASHLIMERFPKATEGELSRLRASLVNERQLASIAKALGVGELLVLGKGEDTSGGRAKESLLADGFEAIVGAIYQESGWEAALGFLRARFAQVLDSLGTPGSDRDYKTRLQEIAQNVMKVVPKYALVSESGPDHDKTFEVNLLLGGKVRGTGKGKSKKEAEQAAARDALEAIDAEAART